MDPATPHQAFPLCPAKPIQEWLSSSDSISRQRKGASLNTLSALIGQAMVGKKNVFCKNRDYNLMGEEVTIPDLSR